MRANLFVFVALSLLALGTSCRTTREASEETASPFGGGLFDPHQAIDQQQLAQLSSARQRLAAAGPGAADEAYALAGVVRACFDLGTVGRGKLDGTATLKEAAAALDAGIAAHPDKKRPLLERKGYMLKSGRDLAGAMAAFEQVIALRADVSTYQAMIEVADQQSGPAAALRLCKTARPLAVDEESRYFLLRTCIEHSHTSSVEEGLSWTSPADLAFYRGEQQKLAERQQRNNERLSREAQRNADAFAASNACEASCTENQRRCMTFCPGGAGSPCGRTCADDKQRCPMACYRQDGARREADARLNAAGR